MVDNIPIEIYSFIPLIISLLLVFWKSSLRTFQALYLLLSALLITIYYLNFSTSSLILSSAGIIIGELLHFILTASLGSSLSLKNNKAILAGIGLFPYTVVDIGNFVLYIALFLSLAFVYSSFRLVHGSRAFGLRWSESRVAKKRLSPEDYLEYSKKTNSNLAVPFLVSTILVMWAQL